MALLENVTWWVEITIFLAVITVTSYFLVRKRSAQDLTTVYLLSITVKLLFSCVFVIAFIVLDKEHANYNVVFFMSGYVIFTAAEVAFLLLKKRP